MAERPLIVRTVRYCRAYEGPHKNETILYLIYRKREEGNYLCGIYYILICDHDTSEREPDRLITLP